MATVFDTMTWGGTNVLATSGDWTRSVGDIELGAVEYQQFTAGAPWLGGDQELGKPRAFGRQFALYVDSVFDGSATSVTGAHYDEIEFLQALFNPGSTSTVELATTRKNTSNSTVSRSIWVRCLAAYPLAFIRDKDASGIWFHPRTTGRIRYRVDCYAPWPFWRDTTESNSAFTTSTNVTNSGAVACGAKIVLTAKSGTVNPLVASNSANSYTVSWTSPANSDAADFGHADPAGAAVVGTVAPASYFRLEPGTNSLTKTITGGGSMTATVYWRANWSTP